MDAPATRSSEIAAAAEALYGGPLERFTAERKRLAAERKRAGDKAGAAAVGKLGKPNQSAWVVNQLYRHARVELDALFAVAEQLREGDLSATGEHQLTLNRLRARAAELLVAGGHAAAEPTLRRVTTTLQALSARGVFAPDLPGQLVGDLDPPGFEAHQAGRFATAALCEDAGRQALDDLVAAPLRGDGLVADRPAEIAEDRDKQLEREQRAREVERRERDVEQARREVALRQEDVAALRDELADAEAALAEARDRADQAAREVAAARDRVI